MTVEHHLDRVIEGRDGSMVRISRRSEVVQLPPARIGRAAIGAGGVLGRLWRWLWSPRVERFRVCARCGFALDAAGHHTSDRDVQLIDLDSPPWARDVPTPERPGYRLD